MLSIQRPTNSMQFIRLRGTLDVSPVPGYGKIPALSGIFPVRFLLALAPEYVQPPGSTGPFDANYRLPSIIFSNNPGAVVQNRPWAQNTDVTIKALDANLTDATMSAVEWGYDNLYGAPWVQLDLTVGAVEPEIDLQIEVKHTLTR